MSVPDGPYEPPLTASFQLPLAYQPPGNNRDRLGPVVLVAGLGLLLCAGAALVAVQSWPHREGAAATPPAATAEAPSPATTTAATATATAAAGRPEIPALPGSAEQDVRNAANGAATSIRFVNSSPATVTVMWLDYGHQRVRYADLAPGRSYEQQTYTGHVWVVTRADGTAIAVYEAAAEPGVAVIR